uniref:Transmembrane protein 210 isoform X3 n=1 Tax=Phascolarctos cinereus TaxID=38626 RepID=A0A6P5JRZ9_PHACI|nr:transmembrane protein 210 isoform X3 [Phascolarctos cinereus]
MDQPRARTVRSAHSSHPALPRAVHRGWRLDMFPRPQSSSGLVGSIPCLLLLVVSVSSAADSISVDGKRWPLHQASVTDEPSFLVHTSHWSSRALEAKLLLGDSGVNRVFPLSLL